MNRSLRDELPGGAARGVLALIPLLVACSLSRDRIPERRRIGPAPTLGQPCRTSVECPGQLTCSQGGESRGQCTVEDCASTGRGPEHGCPDGSFCYIHGGEGGTDCARICRTDEDCQAVNPDLVCEERPPTESFGLKICVLDGSARARPATHP